MSCWIHLNLTFKDCDKVSERFRGEAFPGKRPEGVYLELVSYLKGVVETLSPSLIDRYFYLFEPNPHLFLALEVRDIKDMESVRKMIKEIEKPDFIASTAITENSGDEGNGEAAIDFFNAGTKYAFSRIGKDYKPGYYNNDEVKLVHCLGNQLFGRPDTELLFYLKCAVNRGFPLALAQKCLSSMKFTTEDIERFLKTNGESQIHNT